MFTTHSYSAFCLIILRCKNDEINKKSRLLNVAAALKCFSYAFSGIRHTMTQFFFAVKQL